MPWTSNKESEQISVCLDLFLCWTACSAALSSPWLFVCLSSRGMFVAVSRESPKYDLGGGVVVAPDHGVGCTLH